MVSPQEACGNSSLSEAKSPLLHVLWPASLVSHDLDSINGDLCDFYYFAIFFFSFRAVNNSTDFTAQPAYSAPYLGDHAACGHM